MMLPRNLTDFPRNVYYSICAACRHSRRQAKFMQKNMGRFGLFLLAYEARELAQTLERDFHG